MVDRAKLAIAVVKAGLEVIPGVGGAVASLVDDYVGASTERRIQVVSCSPFVKTLSREGIPRVMIYAAVSSDRPRLAARFSNGVCHASA
jgi:hypothetical protein